MLFNMGSYEFYDPNGEIAECDYGYAQTFLNLITLQVYLFFCLDAKETKNQGQPPFDYAQELRPFVRPALANHFAAGMPMPGQQTMAA